MKKILLLCSLLFSILYLSAKERANDRPSHNFTISGKIINRINLSQDRVINFIFEDILTGRKKYNAILDDSSCFQIKVPVGHIQEFYMDYGTLVSLIAIPGKSIEIEINADILTVKDKKGMIRIMGGSGAATNKHYLRFDDEEPKANYIHQNAIKAIKEKNPDEYKQYILEKEKLYTDFLNKFNKQNHTDPVFRLFIAKKIKYRNLEYLMRYAWLRPLYLRNDTCRVPDSWYSFLKEYQAEKKCRTSSFAYNSFISEYNSYLQKLTKKEFPQASQTENTEYYTIHFRNVLGKHTSEFTKDLVLARYYVNLLDKGQHHLFDTCYEPSQIKNHHLRKILQSKRHPSSSHLQQISLKTQQDPILKELIDTIFSRYAGKILYIDFWAPWCGPCLQQMPYSQKLQKQYAGQNIVFLFLASQCTEKSWQETVREKNPGGEHLKLTDDQYKILATLLNINGIPHYLLVDPEGKIVNTDAPRPSQRSALIPLIDTLLKQSAL